MYTTDSQEETIRIKRVTSVLMFMSTPELMAIICIKVISAVLHAIAGLVYRLFQNIPIDRTRKSTFYFFHFVLIAHGTLGTGLSGASVLLYPAGHVIPIERL